MAKCPKSAVMLDRELSDLSTFYKRSRKGCTTSATPFQVFINDMLKVVEVIGQGAQEVQVRESEVSGL